MGLLGAMLKLAVSKGKDQSAMLQAVDDLSSVTEPRQTTRDDKGKR